MAKKAAAPERSHPDLLGNVVAHAVRPSRAFVARVFKTALHGKSLEEIAALLTDDFRDVQEYLELMENGKTCQRMSLRFNPQRLQTKASRYAGGPSLFDAMSSGFGNAKTPKPDSFYDGLARVYLSFEKTDGVRNLLYAMIQWGIQGTYYTNEFPPHVARDIYREYGLGKDSRILDPCGGWGGRMIGASVVSNFYDCCEPATETAAGLTDLAEHLSELTDGEFVVKPFEDVALNPGKYDLALTSPPYYDTELYSDEETQSSVRYKTFEDWLPGFYFPFIDRTLEALKPGAPFILNVGDRKYPLASMLYAHCEEIGAKVRPVPARVTGGRHPRMADQYRDTHALAKGGGLRSSDELGEAFYEVRLDAR